MGEWPVRIQRRVRGKREKGQNSQEGQEDNVSERRGVRVNHENSHPHSPLLLSVVVAQFGPHSV